MGSEEKLIYYVNSIKSQIQQFDNKANALLGVVSIILTISLAFVNDYIKLIVNIGISTTYIKDIFTIVFGLLYVLFIIIEMALLITIIKPKGKPVGTTNSMSYYKDVIKYNEEQITKSLSEIDFIKEGVSQLRINAKICDLKHRKINIAIVFLVNIFIHLSISIVLLYV